MAGGKKKRPSSAKKNKSRKSNGDGNNKKPIPLEEVLSQAESAEASADTDTALQLFSYAAGVLRSRLRASASDNNFGNSISTNSNVDQDKKTLSTVLGKMGELKASNGDVEGARSDFLNAIELMGPAPTKSTSSATRDGNKKMEIEEGGEECNIRTAQSSESRAGLHLYLGQLSSGTEALDSFRVGVSELECAVCLLERICNAGDGIDDDTDMEGCEDLNAKRFLVETRRQLCAAYCSIAELYLTDLCDEPDAESSCEAALKSALALDEVSSTSTCASTENGNDDGRTGQPDALQTMANFRLSQSRVSEAIECILKAYDRMKVGCEAMSALVGLGNDCSGKGDGETMESKSRELVDVEAASSLPEYNFRCQTAKIMLECASLLKDDNSGVSNDDTINRCAESAIQVLGSLLAENDEVIEVWYLLGCAFMACSPPLLESAHYYWENALTMLNKAKEGLGQSIEYENDDDGCIENELEAIECQIIEVKKKLGKYEDGKGEEDEEMED